MKSKGRETTQATVDRMIPPPAFFQRTARVSSLAQYKKIYAESCNHPDQFWGQVAKDFQWNKAPSRVVDFSFGKKPYINWFVGGQTNMCVNALDRHLPQHNDKPALIYVPNEGGSVTLTYEKLHREVCYCANMLKKSGLKKGDRVVVFLSLIPEAVIAMLACLRMGYVHVVVNPHVSVHTLAERVLDCRASVVITGNQSVRGDEVLSLKHVSDEALDICEQAGHIVDRCFVFLTTDRECDMLEDRDVFWHDAIAREHATCEPVWLDSEDPSFILYSKNLKGKPHGVLHTTAGYMVYAGSTFQYLFDIKDNDICFGTTDLANISGHSYVVYGPLLNASTTVIFEGALDYPLPDRVWEIVEKDGVTILHTDPKALGDLKKNGELWPRKHDLSGLRLLGTLGGPVTPQQWLWFYQVIGKKQCPVIDTWCQASAGGILIGAFPGATPLKPGSAAVPFFGIEPDIVDDTGKSCPVGTEGHLVIKQPWPGMLRTFYERPDLFFEKCFSQFEGVYNTGDRASCDQDGYFWISPKGTSENYVRNEKT